MRIPEDNDLSRQPFMAGQKMNVLPAIESGRQDSNLRLRGPKPRALAKLSYAPENPVLYYEFRFLR
jgi:hypothetical protein